MRPTNYGRLDRVSLAGAAVFGALSVVLAYFSQALGLNFPVIPYLQFDFGEVAIISALFIFGPAPALLSSFVEFGALLALGQNVPVGPILKLFALLSTVAGVWLGLMLASRLGKHRLASMFSWGTAFGALLRAAVLTIPNYYLLVFLYTVPAMTGFLSASFKLVGVSLTETNALAWILVFTGIFNVFQLVLVMAVSFLVLKFPQVSSLRAGGKEAWFVILAKSSHRAEVARNESKGT